jgi:hypothetical protein
VQTRPLRTEILGREDSCQGRPLPKGYVVVAGHREMESLDNQSFASWTAVMCLYYSDRKRLALHRRSIYIAREFLGNPVDASSIRND